MYREDEGGKDAAYLKLYDGHDWKWFHVRLSHTDMEYLRKNWSGKKASAPTLEKRHRKYFLRFSYTEDVILAKIPAKEQIICSVDLGINTDAVCTIMRSDGTVLGRKFINFHSEKDRMYVCWDGYGDSRENMDLYRQRADGLCKTPEYRTGQEDCRSSYKICKREPCRYNCLRIPGDKRKDIREKETETASVEKTGYPETL